MLLKDFDTRSSRLARNIQSRTRSRQQEKVKASTAIGALLLTLRESQVLLGQGTNGLDFLTVNDAQAMGCFGAMQCVEAGSKIYHLTDKTPNGEEWEPLPDGTLEQVNEEPCILHADMGSKEQGHARIF
jgi:hypothetical protein